MTGADAAAVAECNVASWRESYGHVLSAGFLAGMDVARATAGWQRSLHAREAGRQVVAEVDGAVVGFAVTRPSRDEPPVREVELWALYLRVAHHGTGLAQAMLDEVLGDEPASLWVWADNPRAHAFHARNGFVPDGVERAHAEGARIVRLLR